MLLLLGRKITILLLVEFLFIFDLSSLQLGNGNRENQLTPIKILEDVKQVSASTSYSMIVKKDNTLWATGKNQFGQFGNGDNSFKETDEFIYIMNNIKFVNTSVDFSLIIKTDDTLWISGMYPAYINKNGKIVWKKTNRYLLIAENVRDVSSGRRHIIFLKNNNTLWGVGDNTFGQLGLASTKGVVEAVKLQSNIKKIYAKNYYSYYVDKLNYLFLTGDRTSFVDKDGREMQSNHFVKIAEDVKDVSVGFILRTDGSLYSFGYGCYGALGIGRKGNTNEVISFILDKVYKISSNQEHSLILLENGKLLSCGGGSFFNYGSIGNGTTSVSYSPEVIMEGVRDCSVGEYYSLVIKEDSSLWGFGLNNDMEDGLGL